MRKIIREKDFSFFQMKGNYRKTWNNLGKALEPTLNTAQNAPETPSGVNEDYSRALASARIACYDDFRSAPRVTEIEPTTTAEFIENLASTIYTQAQQAGGSIPYTAIREVSENFIHAQFKEIVVSIFDKGNTIRFTDQGPGIPQKEKAQLPGFSSATSDMKRYIRGVGSGLPLVKEYLSFSHGRITIEDNIKCGSVVTISVKPEDDFSAPAGAPTPKQRKQMIPALSDREMDVLYLFMQNPTLRVTDVCEQLSLASSSAHRVLKKLEEDGLVATVGRMRQVTDEGQRVIEALF